MRIATYCGSRFDLRDWWDWVIGVQDQPQPRIEEEVIASASRSLMVVDRPWPLAMIGPLSSAAWTDFEFERKMLPDLNEDDASSGGYRRLTLLIG
ncbi:hypothetical protein ACLOJK_023981 [Asimina triloba]